MIVCIKLNECFPKNRKYNESIGLGEKLSSVYFKLRDMIHECHKYMLSQKNKQ
jgi:hypothetical protein